MSHTTSISRTTVEDQLRFEGIDDEAPEKNPSPELLQITMQYRRQEDGLGEILESCACSRPADHAALLKLIDTAQSLRGSANACIADQAVGAMLSQIIYDDALDVLEAMAEDIEPVSDFEQYMDHQDEAA